MKRTKIISGLLAAVWSAAIFGIVATGFFSINKIEKDIFYGCDGHEYELDGETVEYPVETLSYKDSFSQMENYFYNLRRNFGHNSNGSCGYVALGMMLTYYDSYWNDALVPEQYDSNAVLSNLEACSYSTSPGSNETSIANAGALSEDKYIQILVNNYSNSSLHAKLVGIGSSMGYGLSLTFDMIRNTLEKYLEENKQVSIDDWVINYDYNRNYKNKVPDGNLTYSEMMAESVKDYLKLDIPVVVTVIDDGNKGHVVIAYDYDEENDVIYTHYGWYGSYTHVNVFSSGNKYVTGYITMGPRRSHSHSNNYIVGGVAMCSCALPNHKHVFTYKSNNAVTHTKSCFCGYSATENHRFKRGTGINSKYLICQSCTYMKLDDGTITPVLPNL